MMLARLGLRGKAWRVNPSCCPQVGRRMYATDVPGVGGSPSPSPSSSSSLSSTSTPSASIANDDDGAQRSPPPATATTTTAIPPKTRRRFPRFDKKDGVPELTLEHFLIRSKVLALYRSFIRNTRGLGDLSSRHETVAWVRSEFEHYRGERDLTKIKSLLAGGKRQLKHLQSSTMLIGQQGDKYRGSRRRSS